MEHYQVTMTGTQPLVMHHDDISWADEMDAWKDNKDNKKGSKAGDDRSPAHRWLGNLYHDKTRIVVPTANIMRCIMEGAAMVPVPGAKGSKTFKAQSQSGIQPMELYWPVLVKGKEISVEKILKLTNNKKFKDHEELVRDHGFELFIKRARVGASKHVRVRPIFQTWVVVGRLAVSDEQITHDVLQDIFEMGGRYKGVGDWRPSSPKSPGCYGIFEAKVEQTKN